MEIGIVGIFTGTEVDYKHVEGVAKHLEELGYQISGRDIIMNDCNVGMVDKDGVVQIESYMPTPDIDFNKINLKLNLRDNLEKEKIPYKDGFAKFKLKKILSNMAPSEKTKDVLSRLV